MQQTIKEPSLSVCIWSGCKVACINWFCQEHYLLKETGYAIYDLTAPDEVWNGGHNKDRQHFKDWGIERLINYAKFMAKKEIV